MPIDLAGKPIIAQKNLLLVTAGIDRIRSSLGA
jgi:hypothetical protein